MVFEEESLMVTYVLSPVLALSLVLWAVSRKCCRALLVVGLVIHFSLTKPLVGWDFIFCLL